MSASLAIGTAGVLLALTGAGALLYAYRRDMKRGYEKPGELGAMFGLVLMVIGLALSIAAALYYFSGAEYLLEGHKKVLAFCAGGAGCQVDARGNSLSYLRMEDFVAMYGLPISQCLPKNRSM